VKSNGNAKSAAKQPLESPSGSVCGGQDEFRDFVATHVGAMRKGGGEWLACADAIESILAGERDEQRLCDNAGPISSMIIDTILRAIADPTTLSALRAYETLSPPHPTHSGIQ
jgi:hypothetical protein